MIVTHVLPSAFTLLFGFAVTVESEWLTGPAVNVTVALGVILVPPTRAVTVLVSARAEESRAVVSPFVSVSAGLVSELPTPLTRNVTAWPAIGLLLASLTTTVRVE